MSDLTLEDLMLGTIEEAEPSTQAKVEPSVYLGPQASGTGGSTDAPSESFAEKFARLAPKSAARYEQSKRVQEYELSRGHGAPGDPATSSGADLASSAAPVLLETPPGEHPLHPETPKRGRGRPRGGKNYRRPDAVTFVIGQKKAGKITYIAGPDLEIKTLLATKSNAPESGIYKLVPGHEPVMLYRWDRRKRWVRLYRTTPVTALSVDSRVEYLGGESFKDVEIGDRGTVVGIFYDVKFDNVNVVVSGKHLKGLTKEEIDKITTPGRKPKPEPKGIYDRECPICGKPCVGAKGLGRHRNSAHPMRRDKLHPVPEKSHA